uniref:Crp/Fnr family transcriptional regulator n=1 Tax=Roseivirga sp. TaxID=1964215 RepID=UPI004048A4E9
MKLDVAFLHFSKLIELDKKEQLIFQSLIKIVSVNNKEFLLTEGQICRYEFFVLKGCLRSFYTDEFLKEHTTMFALEGWWTGELKSFYRGIPANISIQAIEDSLVIQLSQAGKEALFEQIPKFERYFRILFQNRLITNEDRIANHLSSSAVESYTEFRLKHPNLEQRIPQKYIASYLGITPTYLSRLRKKRLL